MCIQVPLFLIALAEFSRCPGCSRGRAIRTREDRLNPRGIQGRHLEVNIPDHRIHAHARYSALFDFALTKIVLVGM